MAVERARWLQPPVWLVNLPRWWLGELAAQFPRAAQWLGGAGGGARLVCGDFRTVLKGDAGMELKCWDNALGALTDTQRRDLRAACPAGEVDIELSTVQALQIEVRIPEAARDIGQAVRMALLADSPLRLEAIAFDWRLGGDGDSPTLRPGWKTAQVALCRLATLHQAQTQLAAAGLTPRHWVLPNRNGTSPPFLLHRAKGSRARWLPPQRPLLLATALGIAMAGPLAVGFGSLLAARSLKAELDMLQIRQQAALTLAQRAARVEAITDELQRWQSQPVLAVLVDDLAGRLPDGAWLTELSVDGPTLKAAAMATDPNAAVRGISASASLEGVRIERKTGGSESGSPSAFELSARRRSER